VKNNITVTISQNPTVKKIFIITKNFKKCSDFVLKIFVCLKKRKQFHRLKGSIENAELKQIQEIQTYSNATKKEIETSIQSLKEENTIKIFCQFKSTNSNKISHYHLVEDEITSMIEMDIDEKMSIYPLCDEIIKWISVKRKANIVPKPDIDHSICKNYMPISLLSGVGKLLERIITMILMWYLNENELLQQC
ncbi:hypothetical protein RFI_28485, partial [Reticulomyxa filosa]